MPGSLGLPNGVVRVVPYDPAWPALFDAEAGRLAALLVDHGATVRLEHMGSTAVPGLAAKPVLDILGGWTTEADRAAALRAFEAAGYVHRGEQGIRGRDFFRRGDPRQYHLHLTRVGSAFWDDHLTFRDHLRTHPLSVAAYAAVKHELAARHPTDRPRYIDGKTDFVAATLAAARQERAGEDDASSGATDDRVA